MKKRTEFATRILISGAALLILSAAFLTGCDPDGDGGIFPSRYNYDFTEEEAMEINLGVYQDLTDYAVYGPGTYASVRGITVEDDYGSDIYNAQYWNEVTVDFDDHEIESGFTVDGAGIVKATMDSYNGMYIMEYTGTFTGEYEGEDYRLEMDFLIEWGSYASFSSEGTFSVNGEEYTFSVDASDLPGYESIPTQ